MPERWPRRTLSWLAATSQLASAWAQEAPPVPAEAPRLHVATFSDIYDPRLLLPLASAYTYGLAPTVVGLGTNISWGKGMGGAFNAYRAFVYNRTQPDDVVLFIDAYDVMFQAGEAELVARYLEMEARSGRQIIYNADVYCSSPRKEEYPPCASPWRYLNSGIYMGRARALRRLFRDLLPADIVDSDGRPLRLQNWHTNFFLEHQDLVLLDTNCELTQVVLHMPNLQMSARSQVPVGFPAAAMNLSFTPGGRVWNRFTNTTPLILHFPGPGHWPEASDEVRVGTCLAYELLRRVNPGMLDLMERRSLSRTHMPGTYFGPVPWKPVCTMYVSPFDLVGYRIQHLGDYVIWWYFHGCCLAVKTACAAVLLCILACFASRYQASLAKRWPCGQKVGVQSLAHDVKDV